MRRTAMSAADAPPVATRADKIVVAITEAVIAAQRNPESSSTAWVDTTATLEALAEVAARIAFQTKIAVTAVDGCEFAEWVADRIGRNFKALRKSRDKHSFAPVHSSSRWYGTAKEGKWMTAFSVAVNPDERI
jgi:hypothetical protein